MLIKILEPNFKFKDDRGSLVQLVREGYKQFNVITSVKGAVRGGHYHTQNSEAFYIISGKLKIEAWDANNTSAKKEEYIFKDGDMFEIPKDVLHSFYFEDDTLLVSMYSNGVELKNGTMDIISA